MKSSSRPTSPGTATTTRASRSTSRRRRSNRLVEGLVLKNRLVFDGTAGDGTFITTPSTCLGEAIPGTVRARLLDLPARRLLRGRGRTRLPVPARARSRRSSRRSRPGPNPKECDTIPYDPSARRRPRHRRDRLARRRHGRRRRPAHPRRPSDAGQLQHEDRAGLAAGRDGPQPLRRRRPAGLQRRAVRQGDAGTRSPARPPRRSAR